MKAGIEGEDHRMRQVRSASGIAGISGRTVRTDGQVDMDSGFAQTAWNCGRSSQFSNGRLTCLVHLPLPLFIARVRERQHSRL